MSTAGQRLAQLSGLPGSSAAEQLMRIAGAAGVAGTLLAAYSGLSGASAAAHLLADRAAVSPPLHGNSGGRLMGLAFRAPRPALTEQRDRKRRELDILFIKP